jgi:cell division protein FtsN
VSTRPIDPQQSPRRASARLNGARMTSRDYKTTRNRPMAMGRWREFGVGALVGVVVAVGVFVYITEKRAAASAAVAETPRPEPHRVAPLDPDPTATASTEKYTFYDRLPNFEVIVPEKDKEVVKRDLPATAPIERPGVYVLQAGSYRNEADADRVRTQLALQGIQATVQRVAVDTDVWHRVRIGPITKLDQLNRLRKQLQAADVDALVIRVGD